jgi:multiple sugar transport system substrate-binding protein
MIKKLFNALVIASMLAVFAPIVAAAPPAQGGGQDYVVVKDDWLSKLADKYLGNRLSYPAIVALTNEKAATDSSYAKVTNPDRIEVGWKLYIPSAAEARAYMGTYSPAAASGQPVTIRVLTMDQAAMSVDQFNQVATEFMAANPNIKVEMTFVPYEQVHDKFVTGMAATPPAYDVVMVDVIWYDEFIKAGYLADVTAKTSPNMRQNIFPTAWNVVTRGGKAYGAPWLLDTKYLYYNKDMLAQAGFNAPPKTWEELLTQAKAVKDKGLVEYPIVWSWAQAEASICDFTALLYGNGGKFLDDSGKPAFNDDKGVAVLTWMKKTLDDGLSNPASPTDLENNVLDVFNQGKAAFALNWLFMYDTSNFDTSQSTVTGKVGITTVPVFQNMAGTSKSESVDGSTGFSVAATSPNIDAAWQYLMYLTSEPVQMKYSSNMLPVWATAYQGDNLAKLEAATKGGAVTVPAFEEQFKYAVLRPNIPYYQEGSTALQLALQQALTGQKTPKDALDAAAAKWVELAAQK